MLTFTHSSRTQQLNPASIRSAASGLASETLNQTRPLQQPSLRLQKRSSAAQPNSFSTASANTRVSRLLVLQGRNASAVKVAGNGTSTVTLVRQMHSGGSWEFFNNGQFRFTPAGLGVVARTDLFPVVGTYRATASSISLSGSRSSANSTSRNSVLISGTIVARNGRLTARILQRTVNVNAAVVNGTSFGSTIDRTVRIDMNMVRIG